MADNETSYLKEMLFSRGNIAAVLGALAASVAIAIPYGLQAGLIPLVGLAVGEVVAVLAIPFSRGPDFIRTLHYDPSVLGDPAQHCS